MSVFSLKFLRFSLRRVRLGGISGNTNLTVLKVKIKKRIKKRRIQYIVIDNKIITAAAPLAELHFFTPFKAICFLPVVRKISLQQHKQKACQLDFCIKHLAFFTKIVKTA